MAKKKIVPEKLKEETTDLAVTKNESSLGALLGKQELEKFNVVMQCVDKAGALNAEGFNIGIKNNKDFALIPGKNGKQIEINRNFALKIIRIFGYSFVSYTEPDTVISGPKPDIIVKVRVRMLSPEGRFTSGVGGCALSETTAKNEASARVYHDALAIAETRAIKRAMESLVGLPFINELIFKIFGKYEVNV
jgi:hypothetical protein